jgi:hypothetical protein
MEIFRKINQNYEVSNLGRVKSRARKRTKGGIIKPMIVKEYHRLTINIEGKKINKQVHRLVAEAFIPNPDGKPQINHINGIKTDNRVENLEWCTLSENMLHAFKHGLKSQKGSKNSCSKLIESQVIEIREKYSTGKYTTVMLAKEYNVSRMCISAIINNRNWKNV